jgi:hypothetical protein
MGMGGARPDYAIISCAMKIERRTLIRYGGTGLLTLAVLTTIVWGGWAMIRGASPVDTALEDIRRVPLIGPVMAEHPAVERRMRAAIEEELRSPSQSGLSRPYGLVTDIRRQYIVPALRNADDATAVAAVAARLAFAHYLRGMDTAACRQFALGTLQRPDLLDAEGQRLFRQFLQTLEAAWRSGKAGKPLPTLSRDELTAVLQEAGFTRADFDRLNTFKSLSNEVSCDVEIKVDSVPPQLPADKRGPFSRSVLSN